MYKINPNISDLSNIRGRFRLLLKPTIWYHCLYVEMKTSTSECTHKAFMQHLTNTVTNPFITPVLNTRSQRGNRIHHKLSWLCADATRAPKHHYLWPVLGKFCNEGTFDPKCCSGTFPPCKISVNLYQSFIHSGKFEPHILFYCIIFP